MDGRINSAVLPKSRVKKKADQYHAGSLIYAPLDIAYAKGS